MSSGSGVDNGVNVCEWSGNKGAGRDVGRVRGGRSGTSSGRSSDRGNHYSRASCS